ncbi:MAG: RsfS/YbeB/iojap family protein, partial [Pseudomonadales bacterium]
MKAGKLKELVIEALDDLKGREVICLKVAGITTITDYMVVATGTST